MNLALTMSNCQHDTLVSQVRLLATYLNTNNFDVEIDESDDSDIETILIDNGVKHLEISIGCSSGILTMLHEQYDEETRLIEIETITITHITQVLRVLFPDYIWDKVAEFASDYVQDSTTENLELFALVAIAQLL